MSKPVFDKWKKHPKNATRIKDQGIRGLDPSGFPIGYVETDDGLFYFLDSDGTGPEQPPQKISVEFSPIYRDCYSSKKLDEDGNVVGGVLKSPFSCATSWFWAQDIIELPILREIPLEDFIRSFGSRLERNFRVWAKKLEPLVRGNACAVASEQVQKTSRNHNLA